MTTTSIPAWADCTVAVGTSYAEYLEQAGTALGGLRIMDLGDGRAALDAEAVSALMRQPEDADGCIEDDGSGLLLWIQGGSFRVARVVPAVTGDQIRALRGEAGTAGDLEQAAICDRALAGDSAAWAGCERVIADARA